MIYFLKRGDGAIKLGTTVDYERRHGEHVKQHGELELLGICDGDRVKEQSLIQEFASYLIEGREWFEACSVIMDYIAANTSLDIPKPEGVRARVVIAIHPTTHAVLNMIRVRHMAEAGERLTIDEILWHVFQHGAHKAVEAVLAMGAEPPFKQVISKSFERE